MARSSAIVSGSNGKPAISQNCRAGCENWTHEYQFRIGIRIARRFPYSLYFFGGRAFATIHKSVPRAHWTRTNEPSLIGDRKIPIITDNPKRWDRPPEIVQRANTKGFLRSHLMFSFRH